MKTLLQHLLGLLLLSGLLCTSGQAQTWQFFENPSFGSSIQVMPTQDHGILGCAGNMIRFNIEGDELYRKTSPVGDATAGCPTDDGGFVFLRYINYSGLTVKANISKTDAMGNFLWTKLYDGSSNTFSNEQDVIETQDGGFALAYGGLTQSRLLKLDSLGDSLWIYEPPTLSTIFGVTEDDAGFLYASGDYYNAPIASYEHLTVYKFGPAGDTIWIKSFGGGSGYGRAITYSTTGDIYVAGDSALRKFYVVKLDTAGNEQWKWLSPSNTGYQKISDIKPTTDGGAIAVGTLTGDPDFGARVFAIRFHADGSIKWQRYYDNNPHISGDLPETMDYGYSCYQAVDGGFVFGAHAPFFGGCNWIFKTDSMGKLNQGVVAGFAYQDINENCAQDPGELPLSERLILIGGDTNLILTTDTTGHYMAILDSGSYSATFQDPTNFWYSSSCAPSPAALMIDVPGSVTSLDFPAKPNQYCPQLRVDISTPRIRMCSPVTYYTTYSNDGTIAADSAYIIIDMDPNISIDSASIPWSLPQTGNQYRFDLGTIHPGDRGNIKLFGAVSCGVILGQAHCVTAHIYPDSSCYPPSPSWDGSSIQARVRCTASDSVEMVIKNVSALSMVTPGGYTIIEDNIMRMNDTFLLNAGDSIIFIEEGKGSTWHLKADQSPHHPGLSSPAVSLEGCGVNTSWGFSIGYLTGFPEDDADPFISMDCQQNVGPYDPNDKTPTPGGVDSLRYIEATDELEYRIRFQNTGTDTAYYVIIRDTLSPFLDPTTIVNGAHSHPVEMVVYDTNKVKWIFREIMLPDSNTNEPESHGFVKFRIKQISGNPDDTRIENKAGIYFDFNPPIITNTAFNTIGSNFFGPITKIIEMNHEVAFNVYPNPMRNAAIIEYEGANIPGLRMQVCDLSGATVKEQPFGLMNRVEMHRGAIPSGIYVLVLRDRDQIYATGKVVIID